MSYAIRIFMAEHFSEKPYREFIADIQNLFGKWSVTESTPFNDTGWTIHECRLESETCRRMNGSAFGSARAGA